VIAELWGAHASRVLAIASSRSRTFSVHFHSAGANEIQRKDCFGATPLRLRSGQAPPTRETRVLPRRRNSGAIERKSCNRPPVPIFTIFVMGTRVILAGTFIAAELMLTGSVSGSAPDKLSAYAYEDTRRLVALVEQAAKLMEE